jgi:hypothetical protein
VEHMDHPWKIVPASLIIFQLRVPTCTSVIRTDGVTATGTKET